MIKHKVKLAQKEKYISTPINETVFTGEISGIVKKLNVATDARVVLFNKQTFKYVASTVSKMGVYKFEKVPLGVYFVVALDPNSAYNAVIQDNVVLE